jgi:hypothetical protein
MVAKILITIPLAILTAVVVLFCIPGVYVPIPEHNYRIRNLVDTWTGDETISVSGYTSLDRKGDVVLKLRVMSADYKPLIQRALDIAMPPGKIAKHPGLRVWLDELTLSSAAGAGDVLRTSTHMKARITNDITGTDHKEKEVSVTFDLGIDEAKQMLVLTCNIGNINSVPGDIEKLMNSACSAHVPICEFTEGVEVRDFGYVFTGEGKTLGIEAVGRVQPYSLLLNRAKRWLGMEHAPLTCGGKSYAT